jgi:dihydropteroate synthase
VIEEIRKRSGIPISIDTSKVKVATEALGAGADIINDISGCRLDPEMAPLAAKMQTPVVIMHIKGTPKDMQRDPIYNDVVSEIKTHLSESINLLQEVGLPKEKIIIDPGIGFGKTTGHNLTIMNHLEEFAALDCPILIGASRKSVIGNVLDLPVDKRLMGTAAAVATNIMKGAHIVRVHDVKEMRQVADMTDAILNKKTTQLS